MLEQSMELVLKTEGNITISTNNVKEFRAGVAAKIEEDYVVCKIDDEIGFMDAKNKIKDLDHLQKSIETGMEMLKNDEIKMVEEELTSVLAMVKKTKRDYSKSVTERRVEVKDEIIKDGFTKLNVSKNFKATDWDTFFAEAKKKIGSKSNIDNIKADVDLLVSFLNGKVEGDDLKYELFLSKCNEMITEDLKPYCEMSSEELCKQLVLEEKTLPDFTNILHANVDMLVGYKKEKDAIIKADQENREKRAEEERQKEIQRQKDIDIAKAKAEEDAKIAIIKAEEDKKIAIEEARMKAVDDERQRILDEELAKKEEEKKDTAKKAEQGLLSFKLKITCNMENKELLKKFMSENDITVEQIK